MLGANKFWAGTRVRVAAALVVIGAAMLFWWLTLPMSGADVVAQGMKAWERRDLAALEEAIWTLEGYDELTSHQALLKGGLALQQGRLPEAVEQFRQAAEDDSLRPQAMTLAGQALYQSGNGAAAEQVWTAVLKENPDHVDAHRWLGAFYYDVGAMQNALDHLSRVAELAPDDPRPDRLMGLICKDYERFDDAVRHYRAALRRGPEPPMEGKIRIELAESLIKLHRFEQALHLLSKSAASPVRESLQAECFHNLGRAEQAMNALKAALALDSKHIPALLLQADILLAQGKARQAVKTLQSAVTIQPQDHRIRHQLAQALRAAGETKQADEQAALADELRRKWKTFSELHLQAIREPSNAAIRFEMGVLANELGRPQLAQNWFRAALAIDPTNVDVQRQLQAFH